MSGPNKLTNITNRPNAKDVYGHTVWKSGDEFPPFSTRDPAGSGSGPLGIGLGAARAGSLETENPLGGNWNEEGMYCDTCKTSVSIADLAGMGHQGHNVRNGSEMANHDVENIHRTGGEYELNWKVSPNDSAYAPKPNESESPMIAETEKEAGPDTIA